MLALGHIEPSESPWGAGVLFAPKEDESLRFCVDFRGMNTLTKKNGYPLPRADQLINTMRQATVFSKIDLRSGYH